MLKSILKIIKLLILLDPLKIITQINLLTLSLHIFQKICLINFKIFKQMNTIIKTKINYNFKNNNLKMIIKIQTKLNIKKK